MSVLVTSDARDDFTHADAVAATADLRAALCKTAQWAARTAELIEYVWAMRADSVLGYESWEAYCAYVLSEIREIRLSKSMRSALVEELRGIGMSLRAIGASIGVSPGTVRKDLEDCGSQHSGEIRGIDGREYVSKAKEGVQTPEKTKIELTLESLHRAKEDGLTCAELCRARRWHHGQGSSVLSRAERLGKVSRTERMRAGQRVYVLTPTVDALD